MPSLQIAYRRRQGEVMSIRRALHTGDKYTPRPKYDGPVVTLRAASREGRLCVKTGSIESLFTNRQKKQLRKSAQFHRVGHANFHQSRTKLGTDRLRKRDTPLTQRNPTDPEHTESLCCWRDTALNSLRECHATICDEDAPQLFELDEASFKLRGACCRLDVV
jgi:hypothetical protein